MAKEKYITKTYQVYQVELKGVEGKKEFVNRSEEDVREACAILGMEIISIVHTERRYGIPESVFLANAKEM